MLSGQECTEPPDEQTEQPSPNDNGQTTGITPHEPDDESTEPISTEPVEEDCPALIALALLENRFGDGVSIVYLPDLDKEEDGVQLYGFSVDYTGMHGYYPNGFAYAWSNAATTFDTIIMKVDEPYQYANIPDAMFPIPKKDSVEIPYIYFVPPCKQFVSTYYVYVDSSIMDTYGEQLREIGFRHLGSAAHIESLWRLDRSEDGMVLVVEMFNGHAGFVILMYVWDGR